MVLHFNTKSDREFNWLVSVMVTMLFSLPPDWIFQEAQLEEAVQLFLLLKLIFQLYVVPMIWLGVGI